MFSQNACSVVHVARITLQTCSPLSIGSGFSDAIHDNLIVRDANGLPAIPGSSLAGVLKHLYTAVYGTYGTTEAKELFGGSKENTEAGKYPSRIHISWGCIHDSENEPVEGLMNPGTSQLKDPVLRDAMQRIPIRRDHVRINDKGAADTRTMAKFDRVSLTAGHRFTFELVLWSKDKDAPYWKKLLNLLDRPDFRLGGFTRRGLGKIKIHSVYEAVFELDDRDQLQAFSALPDLSKPVLDHPCFQEFLPQFLDDHNEIKIFLNPEPEGFRFGGIGDSALSMIDPDARNKRQPDIVPVIEKRIEWQGNKGSVGENCLLLPASGIKGAIKHRTLYYYSLLWGNFADKKNKEFSLEDFEKLFGYIPEGKEDTRKAKAGQLVIDDLYLPLSSFSKTDFQWLTHNSIDRFTGGVRDKMLYSEEVMSHGTTIELTCAILGEIWVTEGNKRTKRKSIQALEMAINDLKSGRLTLGAAGGRIGAGFFRGDWELNYTSNDMEIAEEQNEA